MPVNYECIKLLSSLFFFLDDLRDYLSRYLEYTNKNFGNTRVYLTNFKF